VDACGNGWFEKEKNLERMESFEREEF